MDHFQRVCKLEDDLEGYTFWFGQIECMLDMNILYISSLAQRQ